jgi:transposase
MDAVRLSQCFLEKTLYRGFHTLCVPTSEQEAFQALTRHRYGIAHKRTKVAIQGHSATHIWVTLTWCMGLAGSLGRAYAKSPGGLRKEVLFSQAQLKEMKQEIARTTVERKVNVSRGAGTLTALSLAAEVINWERFQNRRSISSYTGLCLGEYSSGSKRREGSIDRCGNRQVRHLLVETVWRLMTWQPDYTIFYQIFLFTEMERSGSK